MNWGKSIVLAFIIFITFIMYIVIKTARQDVDLIAEDYYAQELNYQDVIDAEKNTLPYIDSIRIERKQNVIHLQLPLEISSKAQGEIYFYRPSDIVLDKKIPIALDITGTQIISTQQFNTGQYILKLSWKHDGKSYFYQHTIFI